MIPVRFIPYAALLLFLFNALPSAQSQSLQQSAETLRQKLQEETKRAKELQSKKKQLDRAIQSNQSSLKRFDKILRNYQYNLNQAQKVIDEAQTEIDLIQQRNDKRILFFTNTLKILENNPSSPAENSMPPLIREAASRCIRSLFEEIQSEKPRLAELVQIIEEKQALQDRIFTRYLPADLEKKEIFEQVLNEKNAAAQEAAQQTDLIQQKIDSLQSQIAKAEEEIRRRIAQQKRIAEKKRLSELKRLQEEEKRKRQIAQQNQASQAQTAASVQSDKIPLTKIASSSSGGPLQGKMTWPAQGSILRPFGEFTHPEYGVKMKSYGIDLHVSKNQLIRSAAGGSVFFAGEIAGFGPTVILDHGGDYVTVYGKVKASVSENQSVSGGQNIGRAAGSDMHFEIRRSDQALNPLRWLRPR